MGKVKKFDWTKITKGRGDSGKTSTLFGAEVDKDDFSLFALNTLESAHVSYGKLLAAFQPEDKPFIRFELLYSLDLDSWFLDLGAFFSCRGAGHELKQLESMRLCKTSDQDLLMLLTQNLNYLGEIANELEMPGDWLHYGHVGCKGVNTASGFAFLEFTVRLRELEVEFHSFVKNLKTYFNANVDAQKVNDISAVLNRLSKYYYLFGRILIHKSLCKHNSI